MTAANRPGTASPEGERPGCDTADLIIIHNLFRRLFKDMPAIVRAVPEGDVDRASFVADYVADLAHGLHIHHTGEDEVLWDRLEQRAPVCALHVGQMREQHARIAVQLDRLAAALRTWRVTASAIGRESVAATLEEIRSTLFAHLGEEEETVAPVAATVLTQKEWDLMGEHGMASLPKSKLLVQLSAILDGLTPEERTHFLQNVPPPARVLWALVGRRQYARQQRRLYADLAPSA